ncbi:MAG TPA: biotin transporter BioY, partial [Acidobacteriota bacterium]|nr:biotin transporter BioY [Acidobacteriota bacterium]
GATGGYVLGWFVAAIVLSSLLDGRTYSWRRTAGSMVIASAIILTCGALHLAMLLDLSPAQAFLMGVAPFVPGDSLKILLASVLVRRWPNPLSAR